MLCPKPTRIRDPAYRKRAKLMRCRVPGCCVTGWSGKVVLAHIRRPGNAGMGMKPSDAESLYLCTDHHLDYDTSPDRCAWLVDMIFIPEQVMAYEKWKSETGR